MVGQSRPASPALFQKARSMIPSSSQRSRYGISSRSKKRRTLSRNCSCSGVKAKRREVSSMSVFLRHSRRRRRRGGETGCGGGLGHSAGFREGRARGDVRMGGRLGQREDRREAGVRAFAQARPMVARLRPEQGGELLAQARIVLAAFQAQFLGEDREKMRLESADRDIFLVGAFVGVVISGAGVEQVRSALVLPDSGRLEGPG